MKTRTKDALINEFVDFLQEKISKNEPISMSQDISNYLIKRLVKGIFENKCQFYEIGEGCSRIVYELQDDLVLKIEKASLPELGQNKIEILNYEKAVDKEHLAEIIMYSEDYSASICRKYNTDPGFFFYFFCLEKYEDLLNSIDELKSSASEFSIDVKESNYEKIYNAWLWIKEYSNDLHSNNIGFDKDFIPVLIDYGF